MTRRIIDYILILLSTVFAYYFCALDLSDTYAYYNLYNTPTLSITSGRQKTAYPTILQSGFSGLGQSFGLGVSLFGFPMVPNAGNLFPATSMGTGIFGIYGPGAANPSLLGFNRFAASNENDLLRAAHPTNFFQGLNQNPFPYSIFENPEMTYYKLLGEISRISNPFAYAYVNYANSLYQNPYRTLLPSFFLDTYQNAFGTPLGSLLYQYTFPPLIGEYPTPIAPPDPPPILPDCSSRMYVMGTSNGNGDKTVYLILHDNGQDPPADPDEIYQRARQCLKVEEENSTYLINLLNGETCNICLYRELYFGLELIWAWDRKWWELKDS